MARQKHDLILASASPRRRAILEELGIAFRVVPAGIEERRQDDETPESYTSRLARQKAQHIAASIRHQKPPAYVLGADTIVVVSGEVLEKPEDEAHARAMLQRLSGATHEVITSVALQHSEQPELRGVTLVTRVRFRLLSEDAIQAYVATGEGLDKAGGYAIQGLGTGLVSEIDGSYSNVVGLPAAQTLELLSDAGVLEAWP